MRKNYVMRATISIAISISIVMITPAFAYLDPGTGSMLLQGLIGGVAAAITVFSLYYQKVKLFFSNRFGKNKKDTNVPK